MTLAMIDAVHHKAVGQARNNFSRNRTHFVEGTDYFSTGIAALRNSIGFNSYHKDTNWQIPSAGRSLTLLTKRGYYKLATTFEDELSWQIRDELIAGYFLAETLVAQIAAGEILPPVRSSFDPMNAKSLRQFLLAYTSERGGSYEPECPLREAGNGAVTVSVPVVARPVLEDANALNLHIVQEGKFLYHMFEIYATFFSVSTSNIVWRSCARKAYQH